MIFGCIKRVAIYLRSILMPNERATMDYKKPNRFTIPDGELLSRITSAHYNVKQYGVELSLPFTIASLSKDFRNGKIPEHKIEKLLSEQVGQFYYDIKTMIFHCAWLGEVLFSRIKDLNDSFKRNPDYQSFIDDFITIENATRECKTSYEKLDFMGHKKLLSEILKKYEKEKKKLPFERKEFSRVFNDVIVQRNNFTHGELFLLDSDEGVSTILESFVGFEIIDKDVLNSYNSCFNYLLETLSLIREELKAELK